jgi:hypothetical protein
MSVADQTAGDPSAGAPRSAGCIGRITRAASTRWPRF